MSLTQDEINFACSCSVRAWNGIFLLRAHLLNGEDVCLRTFKSRIEREGYWPGLDFLASYLPKIGYPWPELTPERLQHVKQLLE